MVCNFLSNATTPLVAGALSAGDKQQVRLDLTASSVEQLRMAGGTMVPSSYCMADPDTCLQAGRVTLQAIAVAGLLGTVVALALIWGAEPALTAMGADATSGPLHDLSLDYLRIRWDIIAQYCNQVSCHAANVIIMLFVCNALQETAAMLQGNSSASGVDHAGWAGCFARTGASVC